MSGNVISLSRHQASKNGGLPALLKSFAEQRRGSNDVFWLKENAEILNILECTRSAGKLDGIEIYTDVYQDLPKRLAFFPQYYRFYLSIASDLEALGMVGDNARQMSEFVNSRDLPRAELSDLQRGEAMRLLARQGIETREKNKLNDRLFRFINHSAGFALPNRKVAYELTHIVFYLSEYGRKKFVLSKHAIESRIFTGILAHLEQNADLLSEVCIALRYAGQNPPEAWEVWIKSVNSGFNVCEFDAGFADHYHEFLVCNWACEVMQNGSFTQSFPVTGASFYSPVSPLRTLGYISEILLAWESSRSASWDAIERRIYIALSDPVAQHLSEVVSATKHFASFWEYFSRAEAIHAPTNCLLTPSMLEIAR